LLGANYIQLVSYFSSGFVKQPWEKSRLGLTNPKNTSTAPIAITASKYDFSLHNLFKYKLLQLVSHFPLDLLNSLRGPKKSAWFNKSYKTELIAITASKFDFSFRNLFKYKSDRPKLLF